MKSTWISYFHHKLKTDVALKEALREVEFPAIDLKKIHPESMFYDDNLLSNLSSSEHYAGISPGMSRIADAVCGLIKRHPPSGVTDISVLKLDGLTCSKTGGRSLADFSMRLYLPHEYYYENPIRFNTDEDFLSNVAHFESRFKDDGLVYHRAWDSKYFIANSDGSHHLAALYRQCQEQGRQYMMRCRVQEHTLDVQNCKFILDMYYPLIIHEDAKYGLSRLLMEFGMDCRLSKLRDECGLIYLPKAHRQSWVVYELLLNRLAPGEIYDLRKYLGDILATAEATLLK